MTSGTKERGAPPSQSGLDRVEALALARVEGSDFDALLAEAAALRDEHKGRVVSYSRKVFIPLTRLCRNRCAYCAFSVPNNTRDAYLPPEEVLTLARAGEDRQCKEALFCLGERPEERYPVARRALAQFGYQSTLDYLVAMCDLVWRETSLLPHCNCGVLDEPALAKMGEASASAGLMLESTSERLGDRGGPHYRCPGKAPSARLETIESAGRLSIPFTSGLLVGIGETPEERVEALFTLKALHERHGHLQEVIIQGFQPHSGTAMAGAPAPPLVDVLRTLALARLIFGGKANIQAPPNLAPHQYYRYLDAGANDWGGISPVTSDLINPGAAWPEVAALRDATEQAGFVLRERLAIYPDFAARPAFVRPRFRVEIGRWLDSAGYVREAAL